MFLWHAGSIRFSTDTDSSTRAGQLGLAMGITNLCVDFSPTTDYSHQYCPDDICVVTCAAPAVNCKLEQLAMEQLANDTLTTVMPGSKSRASHLPAFCGDSILTEPSYTNFHRQPAFGNLRYRPPEWSLVDSEARSVQCCISSSDQRSQEMACGGWCDRICSKL